jgi:phosphoribosylformylglycinamidine synthase
MGKCCPHSYWQALSLGMSPSSYLLSGKVTLNDFCGIVFVGGFSYADVLDSGKGWAGVIKFNDSVFQQFKAFRKREDTFSLGICNG